MNSSLIIVKAKVRLLTQEEGGRSTGIISGYRPNHVFELSNEGRVSSSYMGDIIIDGSESFLPGETKIVTVRFLRNPIVEQYIQKGRQWFIYEVPVRIGEGEILEVLQG